MAKEADMKQIVLMITVLAPLAFGQGLARPNPSEILKFKDMPLTWQTQGFQIREQPLSSVGVRWLRFSGHEHNTVVSPLDPRADYKRFMHKSGGGIRLIKIGGLEVKMLGGKLSSRGVGLRIGAVW